MLSRTLDRFRGCLLGGAAGDALGAPVEFMSAEEIRQRFGNTGIRDFVPAYGKVGAITDDTQMTLFTAEGLIRASHRFADRGTCNVPAVLGRAYLRWLQTQGEQVEPRRFEIGQGGDGWLVSVPELNMPRAPGTTCLSALRRYPHDGPHARNDSKGCGGVMRVAPVGLIANKPFELGVEAARITHGHPSGYLAAGYLAQVIAEVSRGEPLPAALDAADIKLRQHEDGAEVAAAVRRARELAAPSQPSADDVAELGEGWVAEEALAIAVYCAAASATYEEAVVLAVNHSGDSDTTGSITGNILGALHGTGAIPERWLSQLELRDEIAAIAADLLPHQLSEKAGETNGHRSLENYPPW
jgi:ADP-ribosylglycohydrolase